MSEINKGHVTPDKTYIYTCHNCGGKNPDCPYCYALNTKRIIEEMQKGAKGQRYYALLKAFLSVEGKAIYDAAAKIRADNGKALIYDVGYLSLRFGLNFKATCEWLNECGFMRSGMYELAMQHLKVKDIYAEARKMWPELEDK